MNASRAAEQDFLPEGREMNHVVHSRGDSMDPSKLRGLPEKLIRNSYGEEDVHLLDEFADFIFILRRVNHQPREFLSQCLFVIFSQVVQYKQVHLLPFRFY